MRLRFWQLVLLVIAVCSAVLIILEYRRSSLDVSPDSLLARLPQHGSVRIVLDVAAIRDAGLLHMISGSKAVEEPDYTSFVDVTGFNYLNDLDLICGTFAANGNFFAVKGRFDWPALQRYTASQGGNCNNGFCSMPSSQPNRRISFYLLKPDVLALASAVGGVSAYSINSDRASVPTSEAPFAPVWLSVDTQAAIKYPSLPDGLQFFLSPVKSAPRIFFGIQPKGTALQLISRANLPSSDGAATAAAELSARTQQLQKMLKLANQTPNPAEISGILAAGTFNAKDLSVTGQWPLEATFLELVLGASGK